MIDCLYNYQNVLPSLKLFSVDYKALGFNNMNLQIVNLKPCEFCYIAVNRDSRTLVVSIPSLIVTSVKKSKLRLKSP